ncbi:MAG: citrate transporter [Treponema sp.]|jgi:Na+/H+ antiporter NhaD/arsenite permease-like protein|nr:citrate transporter [Treponema sp.]
MLYTKWIILGIAFLMYTLIVIFPEKKSWTALGAALLAIAARAAGGAGEAGGGLPAFGAQAGANAVANAGANALALFREAGGELINWDVLLIFIGSLVIAELFIYSRAPAVIADSIVDAAPNVGIAMVLILIMTGIISAFVENVATVLVMAPIALALCAKLKLNPMYFMTGLAVMANLEGTATLVGDPPSMIFADFTAKEYPPGYGFNEFFFHEGKPSICFSVQIGLLVGALFFYLIFAKNGAQKAVIEKEKLLSIVPSILLILMIVGLAALSFLYGGISHASGALVMGLGALGILWYRFVRKETTAKTLKIIKELDWDTVFFLVGIFVVVGAVSKVGLLDDFAALLSRVIGDNVILGFVLITLVSVLISGFVDNVPYIMVMLPVSAGLVSRMGLHPELYMFALLIGSCLGGNLTPFGASANIVTVGILRKQGVKMTFFQWLKIGLPFTLLTTAAAALFTWFVWK